MRIKRIIIMLFSIIALSGCTATYELNISNNGFEEKISINSNEITKSNYYITAYYNGIPENVYDVDINTKIDGIEYYNTKLLNNTLEFKYKFKENDFFKSNIANSFFSVFLIQEYEYDDENTYNLLSTTDDFSAFETYNDLDEVTINIKTNYEVISTNADKINKNIYTWNLNKNKNKSINLMYNPKKVIDYRTLWEKILDGEYFNIFTISIIIFIIGIIIYKYLMNRSKKINKT